MPAKSSRPHLSDSETSWQKFWKDFWQGEKPKVIIEDFTTGNISPALKTRITKHINVLIADCAKYKIGKTGDSYIRTDKQDYRGSYCEMHLLYRSTSKDYVSRLEEHYIEKYINDEENKNQNKSIKAPGKTMYSYDGYYYLYLVIM
ncbi:MAG: hypothetical protein ACRYG7_47895 [Janthinobacterium lividum]